MRRLYYLAKDLETTQAISARLHEEGITDWHFHVLARNAAGLYSHHIHSARPHHVKDIIRSAEVWAIWSGVSVFVAGTLLISLGVVAWPADWADLILLSGSVALAGAVAGMLKGRRRENQRLATFHDAIAAGQYLLMVDVQKADKAQIRELMCMEFADVYYGGNESTFVRPFRTGGRIYPQPLNLESSFGEKPHWH